MFEFKPKTKPEKLIWIRETRYGLETYINPKINNVDNTTKTQLRAFLDDAVKRLK